MSLQHEIRSLLSTMGLAEGESEESVLERFKDRPLPADLMEDPTPEEMAEDADEETEKHKEKRLKKEKERKEKKQTDDTKSEQNSNKTTAAASKDAKSAAKTKQANNSKEATTNGKPVISLSRPKPEVASKGGKQEGSAENGAPAQPTIPFSKAAAIPHAAPPRTAVSKAVAAAAGLKWWDQPSKVKLAFSSNTATPHPQAKGKKVTLSDDVASIATPSFICPTDPSEALPIAQQRLQEVVAQFAELNGGKGSDGRWMSSVLNSGTLSDKIASMTLLVQESPLHRLDILDRLLAMAAKTNRRENSMAIEAVKDLFLHDLLPPRKMFSFAGQPFFKQHQQMKQEQQNAAESKSKRKGRSAALSTPTVPPPTETELVYWLLESELKSRYLDFLSILETGTHDTMPYIKKQRLMMLHELLIKSPERERVIMSLIVNKLGDGDRKIASKVVFILSELCQKQPGFKLALVEELEQLLYRSNIAPRAQYYAIIFLNQMLFIKGEHELANKLIAVYMLLFKQFLAAGKDEREKIEQSIKKKLEKKYERAVRKAEEQGKESPKRSDFEFKNHSSLPVHKFDIASNDSSDALRSKLLGALLTGINRALPYASTYDIDGDEDEKSKKPILDSKGKPVPSGEESIMQHLDSLFQLVHSTPFNTSIQALMLLYQVLSRALASGKEGINSARFYRALYDKLFTPDLLATTSKHALFLNLMYKALKNDPNEERVAAFIKRLVQLALQSTLPSFICGVLYLVSEVSKVHKCIILMITQPQEKARINSAHATNKGSNRNEDDDDEEEHFRDVDSDEDADASAAKPKVEPATTDTAPAATKSSSMLPPSTPTLRELYDPLKRDPLFSRARSSALWELSLLLHHFHPSVVKFARSILEGHAIDYQGDPLKDFTVTNFLDRFVYKNPKESKTAHETKHAQSTFARQTIRARPYTQVNTPAFLQRGERDAAAIPEDETFFLKYFLSKQAKDAHQSAISGVEKRKGKVLGEDATEEEEDAFADDIIEQEMRRMDPQGWADEEEDEDQEALEAEMAAEEGDEDEEDEDAEMAGEEDEDEDEAAAEAAALAEMEGGLSDEEVDDDDEEDYDEEFNFDSEDGDDDDDFGMADAAPRSKKDRHASVFASAEEFADILNEANEPSVSVKQSAWEKKRSHTTTKSKMSAADEAAIKHKSAPPPSFKQAHARRKDVKAAMAGGIEKTSFKRKRAEAGLSKKKPKGKASTKKHGKKQRR